MSQTRLSARINETGEQKDKRIKDDLLGLSECENDEKDKPTSAGFMNVVIPQGNIIINEQASFKIDHIVESPKSQTSTPNNKKQIHFGEEI